MNKAIILMVCLLLVGCSGPTYQSYYDYAISKGKTVEESHNYASAQCWNSPCDWGSK